MPANTVPLPLPTWPHNGTVMTKIKRHQQQQMQQQQQQQHQQQHRPPKSRQAHSTFHLPGPEPGRFLPHPDPLQRQQQQQQQQQQQHPQLQQFTQLQQQLYYQPPAPKRPHLTNPTKPPAALMMNYRQREQNDLPSPESTPERFHKKPQQQQQHNQRPEPDTAPEDGEESDNLDGDLRPNDVIS